MQIDFIYIARITRIAVITKQTHRTVTKRFTTQFNFYKTWIKTDKETTRERGSEM